MYSDDGNLCGDNATAKKNNKKKLFTHMQSCYVIYLQYALKLCSII